MATSRAIASFSEKKNSCLRSAQIERNGFPVHSLMRRIDAPNTMGAASRIIPAMIALDICIRHSA